MGDWPTEDEEFELMHGDEMAMLMEQEDEDVDSVHRYSNHVRKSLNFDDSQKVSQKTVPVTSSQQKSRNNDSFEESFFEINDQTSQQNTHQNINSVNEFTTSKPSSYGSIFTSNLQMSTNETLNISETFPNDSNFEQSRKRTAEDLFGDINDMMLDEQLNLVLSQPKKQKTTDKSTEDLELISKIVELRRAHKTKHALMTSRNYTVNAEDNVERDKRNLSLSVPRFPFVPLTRSDGVRIYVRFHSEDFEKEDTARLLEETRYFGVASNGYAQVWEQARELLNNYVLSTEKKLMESETETYEEPAKHLWVDVYKPKKYYQLLSDESTNRTLLRWMKLWDKAVFNRNPRIKQVPEPVITDDKKKFFKKFELSTKLDEYGRPEHKIALLCGPPGLGKTTLAHMVAEHAGYKVEELNASDNRNVEDFANFLKNCTQMKTLTDPRPNCLIFDEIDGAPTASIDYLIRFVNGTSNAKKSKKGAKKSHDSILKRPIICICNDLYVPSLRPLRQIAFVVNFPKTSSTRLAERLMEIARKQKIKTDLGAMLTLADKSNHDIRSCLSVLQFFRAQNKPIGLLDVYRTNIGQKDLQQGLFSVWQDIFEIKKIKTQNGTVVASPKDRMDTILQTMSSFGDHERVAQGVYENFPQLPSLRFNLVETKTALDWFVFNDLVQTQIYTSQSFIMLGYLNYAFVVWHFVFGALQRPKLSYPNAGYEARTKEQRTKAIAQEVLRGMVPLARAHNQALSLILDVLPLVLKIITPLLRPANLHLYSDQEKLCLLKIVAIMVDYNLSYIQERTLQGTYEFNLEPNIEEVVIFKKLEGVKRRFMTYANKQLIAREIDMEKTRRIEMAKNCDGQIKKALPNHLQTLKGNFGRNRTKEQKAVKIDFFGRVIQTASPTDIEEVIHKNDIWFSYKEGYSNAVRKRIKISNLK